MKSAIRVLKIILICFLGLISFLAGSLYYVGHQYQNAAEVFWGQSFNPKDKSTKGDFVDRTLLPQGGPLIETRLATACIGSTFLPLVPVRLDSTGEYRVLCGIGKNTFIATLRSADPETTHQLTTLKARFHHAE